MSSRSSRSHSRSPPKRHKKSHKRSRKSSEEGSPPSNDVVTKKEEQIDGNSSSGSFYKPRLPSVMLPPSFWAKLDPKEEDITKTPPGDSSPADSTGSGVKKRRTRWVDDKVLLPGMPTMISANMTKEQEKIYLLQLQIEELTRRLKMSDFGIPSKPEDRSPSPEPIYDQHGKRQNTREVRTRRKIEDQRHQLVTELLGVNPDYKAPPDYKPQQIKFTDKVMIPQEDHPEVNFVGLIIGPRGNTLKTLEKETNAKIIIRGKGSVKDGKMGLVKHGPMPGEEEPLHAYITGSTQEIVAKAAEKIVDIISQGIDIPEGMNELRKQQLRELALLNGTLRENDCLIKLKLMNEAEKIVTNTIICTICGGAGHVTSDCKFRKNPDGTYAELNMDGSLMSSSGGNRAEQQKLDCEYQSLMNELTGKKDSDTNALSLDERRNLMTGSRINGPMLAIAGASSNGGVTTIGATSFNSNGTMNTNSDHNPPSLMSMSRNTGGVNNNFVPSNNQQSYHSQQQPTSYSSHTSTSSGYSGTSFAANGPRYNNNDVFDGYHLLRRTNRNANYSAYTEGDSYRAQHIPALMDNESGNSSALPGTYSSQYSQQQTYQNQQQQQQQQQQWNQWNQYNAAACWNNANMYYQNAYQQQQQQLYQNTNTGFTPPLPKGPPPPPH